MSKFIDINNRKYLQKLLLSLNPNTLPLWGKMNPQQMVEHLVEEVKWTNGKKAGTCGRTAEAAEAGKKRGVYTDVELPQNVFSGELPEHYCFENIPSAVDALLQELDDFDEHFKHPGVTSMHGGFGLLSYDEWLIWHGKHFTHHLKQFKLIPADLA